MIPSEGRIAFDRYTVDLDTRELSCDGQKIPLQEKPFRLLVALLKRPKLVATRAELYAALWPTDVYVDREAGLNTAVRKLRAALRKPSGGDKEILETVPRIGYRLNVGAPRAEPPDPDGEPGRSPPAAAGTLAARFVPLQAALGFALLATLAALALAALIREPGAAPEPMPRDSELRARYIEARSLIGMKRSDLSRARELLRSLTQDAPEFAPAHAYLADACARLALLTSAPTDLDEARRAADRAHQLDPGSAVAHRVLAMVAMHFEWDLDTAGSRLSRALRLDPGDPANHLAYAVYESALGRHESAIAAVRRAVDLEPDSMSLRSDAGHFLLRAGRFREAAAECEMVLRLDSSNVHARDCLLTAYSSRGDFDSARPHAIYLLELAGAPDTEIEEATAARDPRRVYLSWTLEQLLIRSDASAVQIATQYAILGNEDGALMWLEQAARDRTPLLILIPEHPDFSQMRNDPRFREILRNAGLGALLRASVA